VGHGRKVMLTPALEGAKLARTVLDLRGAEQLPEDDALRRLAQAIIHKREERGERPSERSSLKKWVLETYESVFDICAEHGLDSVSSKPGGLEQYTQYLNTIKTRTLQAAEELDLRYHRILPRPSAEVSLDGGVSTPRTVDYPNPHHAIYDDLQSGLKLRCRLWGNQAKQKINETESRELLKWTSDQRQRIEESGSKNIATVESPKPSASQPTKQSDQPKRRGRPSAPTIQARRDIVNTSMKKLSDFDDRPKLTVLFKALDDAKIPLPLRYGSSLRRGTYSQLKGDLKGKVIHSLKQDLRRMKAERQNSGVIRSPHTPKRS
jgi:hypothetical protein